MESGITLPKSRSDRRGGWKGLSQDEPRRLFVQDVRGEDVLVMCRPFGPVCPYPDVPIAILLGPGSGRGRGRGGRFHGNPCPGSRSDKDLHANGIKYQWSPLEENFFTDPGWLVNLVSESCCPVCLPRSYFPDSGSYETPFALFVTILDFSYTTDGFLSCCHPSRVHLVESKTEVFGTIRPFLQVDLRPLSRSLSVSMGTKDPLPLSLRETSLRMLNRGVIVKIFTREEGAFPSFIIVS